MEITTSLCGADFKRHAQGRAPQYGSDHRRAGPTAVGQR